MVSKNNVLFLVIFVVMGLAVIIGVLASSDKADRAAQAAVQARQQQAAAHQAEDHRRQVWAHHLKRDAWDKAHPAEVARRNVEAQERLRQQAVAREEQATRDAEASRVAAAAQAAADARAEKEAHPCDTADALELKAVAAATANDWQLTYDTSMSGIHYNDECDSDNDKIVNAGFFLSFKANAEHELGSGDWQTDYNQANQLLVECQTTPGIYGTHLAGVCESQEQGNISRQTHWEMGD